MALFDQKGSGDIIAQLTADADTLQQAISEKLAITISALGTLAATFILSFALYWKLTLILIWSVAFGVIIYYAGKKIGGKFQANGLRNQSMGNSTAEEAISAIRTTASLGLEEDMVKRFCRFLDVAAKYGFFMRSFTGCLLGCAVGAGYINFALAFWQGARFLTAGQASFVDVVTIALATKTATFSILSVSGNADTFVSAIAISRRIFNVIHRVSPIDSASLDGHTIPKINGTIEFQHVKHNYPARPEETVFDDLNLVIEAGETIAIAGSSGSGKSTLIHLLERFYELAQGRILLDGHDINTLNVRWLRSKICVVSQEPILFDGTVRANIEQGLAGTELEDDNEEKRIQRVVSAAQTACAHDFIMALPWGYETRVGTHGSKLSGGQKQRVAIARALISSANILVLDEATSALDRETERRVQQALTQDNLNGSGNRTTIIIAHRLSTIIDANRILMLESGRITEQGTHAELMKSRGSYYRLVKAQETSEDTITEVESLSACTAQFEGIKDEEIQEKAIDTISFYEPAINGISANLSSTDLEEASIKQAHFPLFHLIRFIALLSRREIPFIFVGLTCSIIAGCEEPIAAILLGASVETLSSGIGGNFDGVQHRANFWSLMFLVLALVQCFVFCLQGVAFAYCSERLLKRVRHQGLRSILKQDVAFFDKTENSAGSLVSFLATETADLIGISGATFGTIMVAGSTLVAALIVSCIYGWKLALVCASVVPVIFAGGYFGVKIAGSHQARVSYLYRAAASYINEVVTGIRTITALNLQQEVLATFNGYLHRAEVQGRRINFLTSFFFAVSQSVLYCCMALGFWYGGNLIIAGDYSLFQFTVVYSTVLLSSLSAGIVFSYAPDIGKAFKAAAKLKSLLERPSKIDPTSNHGIHITEPMGRIEFRNVDFSYPMAPETIIIRNLSLQVHAGQHIALVGETGCGKTTLFSLLERFYDPVAGQILIDDIPIHELNVRSYRRCIGLVSQEPMLFDGSIHDNLVCGMGEVPQIVIEDACRKANIYDFIQSLG